MTKRNDIHRPSVLVPSDYQFIAAFSYPGIGGDPGYNLRHVATMRIAHLNAGGSVFHKGNDKGGCDICGAFFTHGAVFLHVPSNEWITTGWQCADKVEICDAEIFAAKRLALSQIDKIRKAWRKRQDLKTFVSTTSKAVRKALRLDHHIARDMRARLINKPERPLSEKQEALLLRLVEQAEERKTKEASKVEEKHVPAPEGRQVITGTVVSVKSHENMYGVTLKMTVKVETPEGTWLAWGTVPSALMTGDCELRGKVVEFTGTLTRSDRDEHFAFFKRPSKAKKVA